MLFYKAKNVLFDWTDSNESHNIVHIKTPGKNQKEFQVVQGPSGFNSGKPVVNNKFMHRFDKPGDFCVISESARDCICQVKVLASATKTATPQFSNREGEPYVVYRLYKVFLQCETPSASIYYTTDGSTPNELSALYDDDNGAIFSEEGIAILRAIAYSDNCLTSDIFTSQ